MRIMVSSCLCGVCCKYNGESNYCKALMTLLSAHEVIGVCPEVMGGLPTPRVCAEIKDERVWTKDGRDVSVPLQTGAKRALDIALKENVDLVILQSRSPSCGKGQRYSGNFDGTLVEGNGIFAQMLIDHGILVMDVNEALISERLHDKTLSSMG